MNKLFFCLLFLLPTGLWAQITWHDAKAFRIMGRAITEPAMEQVDSMAYTRLPWSKQADYRSELWTLGLHSAGLSVRFRSNSKAIGVRWTVRSNFGMNHMATTGVRGVDLYVLEGETWLYAGTGIPGASRENEKTLISGMDGAEKEFLLNLPLYDGVVKLEIGVDSTAHITNPLNPLPLSEKPIVCYGTSITQGGCASRPGMAYPAIMERLLQREVINLGFSGNGRMDGSIGALMKQIDAGAYLVDCLANCTQEMVEQLGYNFINALVQEQPDIPLYMVEQQWTSVMLFNSYEAESTHKKNQIWKEIYERLCGEGSQNLYYISADKLTGDDNETTVDGVHLTDPGFLRLAKVFSSYMHTLNSDPRSHYLPE